VGTRSVLRNAAFVLYGPHSGIQKFVIDVSEVSYVDSSGCGEVISAHTSIHRATIFSQRLPNAGKPRHHLTRYDGKQMMRTSYLTDQFDTALRYDRYVQTGTDEQQRRWRQVYDAAHLTEAQKVLVRGFVRQMKMLAFSGIWCGDCVEQCPLMQRIAEVNPERIDLRFIERSRDGELPSELRINGGNRVPVILFLSEDNKWCATAGDRTINRYRAIALRRLGPMCPTGIVAPEKEEIDATLGDWLNEVERVQLMLRLTPRLREKYQD
jgi:thiol-disulfide isomerase/thioredoxin